MRVLRVLSVIALVTVLTGCACWTRKVGSAEGNIPVAEAGDVIEDIHFDFDSYTLNAEAKDILRKGSEWLKANPAATVKIEGHCDERGTNEYNIVLGQHRARAAMDMLRSLGVEAERLSTISYGKELPLDAAHNEAAWAKNRRDHLAVQK